MSVTKFPIEKYVYMRGIKCLKYVYMLWVFVAFFFRRIEVDLKLCSLIKCAENATYLYFKWDLLLIEKFLLDAMVEINVTKNVDQFTMDTRAHKLTHSDKWRESKMEKGRKDGEQTNKRFDNGI